ncbi:hypothetical protein BC629DRAFT_966388 [Irpex lacteus]|nr:hypothetical protein BC629DRAFT_966388 [Irpex lacteus]
MCRSNNGPLPSYHGLLFLLHSIVSQHRTAPLYLDFRVPFSSLTHALPSTRASCFAVSMFSFIMRHSQTLTGLSVSYSSLRAPSPPSWRSPTDHLSIILDRTTCVPMHLYSQSRFISKPY